MSQLNFNLLNSAPSDSPIINLIRELILLKFRLGQPPPETDQSEPFSAELQERLLQLESEYDCHRSHINANDFHYFLQAIEKSKELIKSEYQIPILSSPFPTTSYRTTKRRLEDQLYIKKRWNELPSSAELLTDENFILSVFQ
jgi:hypothetical protein